VTVLDPSEVAPVPWRNGAGATRVLATGKDASGHVLWRISVADLEDTTPFSRFPGLDRVLVALGPLRLQVGDRAADLVAGDQVRFAGDEAVSAYAEHPTQALNVMTRHGRHQAEVRLRSGADVTTPGTTRTVRLAGSSTRRCGGLFADVLITDLADG